MFPVDIPITLRLLCRDPVWLPLHGTLSTIFSKDRAMPPEESLQTAKEKPTPTALSKGANGKQRSRCPRDKGKHLKMTFLH